MKPTKKIDRLYQEKLKDLEVKPPEIVWENIEEHLDKKKKKRIVPLWLWYSGAAIILLLISFGAVTYFQKSENGNPIENTITDSNETNTIDEKPDSTNEIIVDVSDDNRLIADETNTESVLDNSTENQKNSDTERQHTNETLVASTDNTNEKISFKDDIKTTDDSLVNQKTNNTITVNTTNDNNQTKIAATKETESNKNTTLKEKSVDETEEKEEVVAYENINNLEDTLEGNINKELKEETEELINRWTVATVIAPVFYNSFNASGSPLDQQFSDNAKQGSQTVSYGVRFGYQISKKFTIQSGVSMMDVGYTVSNVSLNLGGQTSARLENVNYTSDAEILSVNASNKLYDSANSFSETASRSSSTGDLNQEYGYIEVPLELKYRLTNGKFGVHVVAGFSTLFLNANDVYVETADFSSNLGEANNLNDVNFSGNFGLDLDYNINKSLYINVAPMLKVHTSTFSDNPENFDPYVIGIYTGLNYKF